jgi:hypothetical protein
MPRRTVYKAMDEEGIPPAFTLQKEADLNPHVRHSVEALEEAADILNNIVAGLGKGGEEEDPDAYTARPGLCRIPVSRGGRRPGKGGGTAG